MSLRPTSSRFDRRALVSAGVCGAGLILFGFRFAKSDAGARGRKTPWKKFLDRAEEHSRRAVARGVEHEEQDLETLATELANAASPPPTARSLPKRSTQEMLSQRGSSIVARYHVGGHASIPAHDHRGYNGVMRVIRGTVEVRSYELESANGGERWPLRLRETARQKLEAGELAAVTVAGANIHQLIAGPKGVEFIDVFTVYNAPAHSRDIELGPTIGETRAARLTDS